MIKKYSISEGADESEEIYKSYRQLNFKIFC